MHENMATQGKINQQNSPNCWQYKPGQQKLYMAECHTLRTEILEPCWEYSKERSHSVLQSHSFTEGGS